MPNERFEGNYFKDKNNKKIDRPRSTSPPRLPPTPEENEEPEVVPEDVVLNIFNNRTLRMWLDLVNARNRNQQEASLPNEHSSEDNGESSEDNRESSEDNRESSENDEVN